MPSQNGRKQCRRQHARMSRARWQPQAISKACSLHHSDAPHLWIGEEKIGIVGRFGGQSSYVSLVQSCVFRLCLDPERILRNVDDHISPAQPRQPYSNAWKQT